MTGLGFSTSVFVAKANISGTLFYPHLAVSATNAILEQKANVTIRTADRDESQHRITLIAERLLLFCGVLEQDSLDIFIYEQVWILMGVMEIY